VCFNRCKELDEAQATSVRGEFEATNILNGCKKKNIKFSINVDKDSFYFIFGHWKRKTDRSKQESWGFPKRCRWNMSPNMMKRIEKRENFQEYLINFYLNSDPKSIFMFK
jgi:hypothetical protein